MEYNKLPGTNIEVSKICLGTMTWGRQNSESEAFEQMDYSLDHGVNFFDTAELYPVPATPERYADTERIIGNWLSSRNNREKIILASKIAGPGDYTAHIRKTGFKENSIDLIFTTGTPSSIQSFDLNANPDRKSYLLLIEEHLQPFGISPNSESSKESGNKSLISFDSPVGLPSAFALAARLFSRLSLLSLWRMILYVFCCLVPFFLKKNIL